MELRDKQWEIIAPLFQKPQEKKPRRGRPPSDPRPILEGILWGLRTGARRKDMPSRFPPCQTCFTRFQAWREEGLLETILRTLLADLQTRGEVDLSEAYIDGSFVSAKKGAVVLVKQSAVKGPRSWQLRTAMAFLSRSGLRVLRHMK